MPELFHLRTNFAAGSGSSHGVADYASSVKLVEAGLSIDSEAWCKNGHLVAVSLLYDIAVFTYSLPHNQWHVLDESGSRGYVCLVHQVTWISFTVITVH